MFWFGTLWMASSLSGVNEPTRHFISIFRTPIAHAVISSLFAHEREENLVLIIPQREHVGHANEIKCWTSLVLVCVCARASEFINIHTLACVKIFFPAARGHKPDFLLQIRWLRDPWPKTNTSPGTVLPVLSTLLPDRSFCFDAAANYWRL